MKKVALLLTIVLSAQAYAQLKPTRHHVHFELGSGLNFAFNDSAYMFRISGMVQPFIGFEKMPDSDADYFFNSRRSYFNFYGNAVREKVDFFFQLDYSRPDALLDAWIGYHPFQGFSIVFGQKQSIANNREMLFMEDQLQFLERSLLSTEYSRTGREFGIFIEQKFGSNFGLVPQVAVTSGDGRNSFGIDSRDLDVGGFKYAARLDVYPLGYFTQGNDILVADLMHEQTLKMVIGVAASYNDGASQAVGEGHGDFMLYDSQGKIRQPDYRQLYGDILIKFRGFSLLGEYNVSTATDLEGSFKAINGDALLPTEISQYLALGSGYNVQVGYVTTNGYAVDFRYAAVMPEFDNANSIVQELNSWSVGLAKYFRGNNLKIHTALSSYSMVNGDNTLVGELLFQVVF